jgi:hypothetical protein
MRADFRGVLDVDRSSHGVPRLLRELAFRGAVFRLEGGRTFFHVAERK